MKVGRTVSVQSAGCSVLDGEGGTFSGFKGITAVAGYMDVCYGMLMMIDLEEMGEGVDWWGFIPS